jgi:hypothetical protein
MPDKQEQSQGGKSVADALSPATAVHPVIAALEKADASTVVIEGFLGTSADAVIRLYDALDTSAYVEIPKQAVVYIEPHKNGEPGAVRAFVRASEQILSVRRWRVRAGDYRKIPEPVFPPLRTCADFCEDSFKARATAYFIALTNAVRQQNPERQPNFEPSSRYEGAGERRALPLSRPSAPAPTPHISGSGIDATYQAILKRNHMEDAE